MPVSDPHTTRAGTADAARVTPRAWLVPALLAACIFTAYLRGHMGCSDSRWSVFVATSLLDAHDLTLDEYAPVLQQRGLDFVERVGPHYYNVYPVGVSVLAAPVVLALRPIASAAFRWSPRLRTSMAVAQRQRGCAPVDGEPVLALHSWTEQITASAFVTLTALIIFLMARQRLPVAHAIVLATAFAFGTAAWSTASRALWQHGPSMLLLAAALVLLQRPSRLVFAGMALAMAYVVRPTNAVPLAVLSLWSVWTYPRTGVQYALGVALVLVPFFALNQHIYGAWLSTYYQPSTFGGNPAFVEALAGLVVSPGRGLFVYSPLLLFAVAGIAHKIRHGTYTALDTALLVSIAVHWTATAWINPIWWGGDSYGPRLLSDMLPFFFYWLIPAMQWMSSLGDPRRAIARGAFAVAIMWSVAVHAQGVFNPTAMAWNFEPTTPDWDAGKLWDWRHPPFFAGVVAPRGSVSCQAPPPPPGALMLEWQRRNEVALSWQPASGPVGLYVVESGTGPGAIDAPARVTTETTMTVHRVPPGTYYARVRARNPCGTSQPSDELRVTVR